jgi:N-acetylneuraminic acid mutarotase
VVDGKIYVIGGGNDNAVRSVEIYDPLTDTWTEKADMPTGRYLLSTYVVDGKIYATGGHEAQPLPPLPSIEVYDPVTDTWTKAEDMPRPRFGHSTSVVNGKVYFIGGASRNPGAALATVDVYDPQTDTWATSADLPIPRWGVAPGVGVVNGKIYVIGGSPNVAGAALSVVEEYDPGVEVISSVNPARKLTTTWGQIRLAE